VGDLYIIPHERITRVPFHALNIDGNPLIKYKMVRYLPQGAFMEYRKWQSQKVNLSKECKVCVVGDPTEDLPDARLEAEFVADLFGVTFTISLLPKDKTNRMVDQKPGQKAIGHVRS